MTDINFNEEDVRKTYRFLRHSEWTEVRIINTMTGQARSFFTNSEDAFVAMCREYNQICNIYVGVNEREREGTKSSDVKCLRTIVVDIDSVRLPTTMKKQPATNQENEKSEKICDEIIQEFFNQGWNKPAKVFSGNGWQLWIALPETTIIDDTRKHIDKKCQSFITEIRKKFTNGQGQIDQTGDLSRIIKVIGTMNIKGNNIPERPHRLSKSISNFTPNPDPKVLDYVLNQETTDPSPEIKDDDSDIDFLSLIQDNKIKNLFEGRWEQYKFVSRSEAEESLVIKLIQTGLSDKKIQSIMKRCKIGKYQEKVKLGHGDSYMNHLITSAKNFIEKNIKPEIIMDEMEQQKIIPRTLDAYDNDYISLAKDFSNKIQPISFDKSKLWWLWDSEYKFWNMVDDIQVVLSVYDNIAGGSELVKGNKKNMLLNAMMLVGRANVLKNPMPTWIQLRDKIIDVATMDDIIPSPEYLLTNPIMYKMGESEDTPTIDKLFVSWVGEEKKQLLYEIVAYSMLPDYPIHRMFCFVGSGRNGKGSLMRLLNQFLGANNVTSTDLERIKASRFECAKLYKKLVAFVGETDFTMLKETSWIKKLTGQDLISMEFKNKAPFDSVNYAKILIATNSLPMTADKTDGFYSRWVIIKFPNQFDMGKDVISEIPTYEFENLAKKCVRILHDLVERGSFSYEGSISEKRTSYEEQSNPLAKFIQNECVHDPAYKIPFWEFRDKFKEFLESKKYRIISDTDLSKQLKAENLEIIRDDIYIDTDMGKERKQWKFIYGVVWKEVLREPTQRGLV